MSLQLSAAEARAMGLLPDGDAVTERGKARGNKFNAKRTSCRQGHVHASAAEARRCHDLTLMERAGVIRKLQQQPVFHFILNGRAMTDLRGRKIRYTGDFRYEERFRPAGAEDSWREVVEDVKSLATMTEAATLRLALVRFFHPEIDLRTVS